MAGRIVLFGATGYTGRLTAEALVAAGRRPFLAGRDAEALTALAEALGGDLETGVADVGDPASVRALLAPGDVMLTTVGPFARWGAAAIEAAIDAGVPYIDSTGEPQFIKRVFEEWGPRAERAGAPLLTALGYDWVPGNLAAALALAEAGAEARRVQVGYFLSGRSEGGMSGGTTASMVGAMLEPGFAFRGGRVITEASGRRVRSFTVRGRSRQAVSVGSSEHFTLPRIAPQLIDVESYLGWFGPLSRPMQVGSVALGGLTRLPGVRSRLQALAARFLKGSSGGPTTEERAGAGSHVLAIARDAADRPLAEVRLDGVDGYTFTGTFLAWAAGRALDGELTGSGALGPAEAFGLEELEQGVATAGISRS